MDPINNVAMALGYVVGGLFFLWGAAHVCEGFVTKVQAWVFAWQVRPLTRLGFTILSRDVLERMVGDDGNHLQRIALVGDGWQANQYRENHGGTARTRGWYGPTCETPMAAYTAAALLNWGA